MITPAAILTGANFQTSTSIVTLLAWLWTVVTMPTSCASTWPVGAWTESIDWTGACLATTGTKFPPWASLAAAEKKEKQDIRKVFVKMVKNEKSKASSCQITSTLIKITQVQGIVSFRCRSHSCIFFGKNILSQILSIILYTCLDKGNFSLCMHVQTNLPTYSTIGRLAIFTLTWSQQSHRRSCIFPWQNRTRLR